MIRFCAGVALIAMVHGPATSAAADFTTFSGELGATRPAFEAAAGGNLPMETFESFAHGEEVGAMPGVDAHFAPEDDLGNALPLPVVHQNSPVSPPMWIINALNGRPAWSPWVVRPDGDAAIYAFGQVSSQGDWVRISAYDEQDELVGEVDSMPISHSFAGFVSTVPIARIVIQPLGNFDGINGMDDVQVRVASFTCPEDVNDDGVVDVGDLLVVLGAWGSCPGCAADVNDDGAVDVEDLLAVLAAWGPCA